MFFGYLEIKKPGKSSSYGRARYRNRLGVVELVGREPLMFARVGNGVTKLELLNVFIASHFVMLLLFFKESVLL